MKRHLLLADTPEEVWKYYSGRMMSSWTVLGEAVESSLLATVLQTKELLKWFHEVKHKWTDKAAILTMTEIRYKMFVFGPLLSVIVLSSFAIESFLRLLTNVLLRTQYPDNQEAIDGELSALESEPFEMRFKKLSKYGLQPVSDTLWKDVMDLMRYRNQCAHDNPRQYGKRVGEMLRLKRGYKGKPSKTKTWNSHYRFPLLIDSSRPLRLSDALWAAEVHDRFVEAVIQQQQAFALLLEDGNVLGKKHILKEPTLVNLELAKTLAEEWNSEVEAWLDKVSFKDRARFGRELEAHMARSKLHVVGEDTQTA